ncbi:hypothetical protein SELMODRAFT_407910 [Selaginella moellendorffii]|uniref:Uncharacterized protein n=1 Tax=Selaginella moellendorffii TaxID=88036 RepID=D8R559_SELML|nr:hypothetical protein SELMODRAFT_407910 [Selaginella moellendorffii]
MKTAGEEDLSEVAEIERDTELVGFFRLMLSYRRKWKREALEDELRACVKLLESLNRTLGSDYALRRETSNLVRWNSCFWGRFVMDPNPEMNILQAIENLGLEVCVVDEDWDTVKEQCEAFMRLVPEAMKVVYDRLGMQKQIRISRALLGALPLPDLRYSVFDIPRDNQLAIEQVDGQPLLKYYLVEAWVLNKKLVVQEELWKLMKEQLYIVIVGLVMI